MSSDLEVLLKRAGRYPQDEVGELGAVPGLNVPDGQEDRPDLGVNALGWVFKDQLTFSGLTVFQLKSVCAGIN